MKNSILAFTGLFMLAACADDRGDETTTNTEQEQVSGDVVANELEEAAAQSDPAAAEVLEDAAETARGRESMTPVDEPGSFAQEAMEEAGEAAASN